MTQKVIVILVVAFIAKTLIACCRCPEPPNQFSFKHTAALAIHNLDNSGESPIVANSSTLKEAFGIRLEFSLERLAFQETIHSIFSSAYACSCENDHILNLNDTISFIKITTNNKFNNTFDAGAEVTQLFRYAHYQKNYITIDELLSTTISPDNFIDDYDLNKNERVIDLLLLTPPDAGLHSFTIEIELSNGDTISGTTAEITLN